MSLAGFALKRPYTVVAGIMLVCMLAAGALVRMPTDIFPEIDIPVVSVVWTYNGMSAPMKSRTASSPCTSGSWRRWSTTSPGSRPTVIRGGGHQGLSARRCGRQPGDLAIEQLALVVLKYMPRNITPPLILRYGATDVPIIQLSIVQPVAAGHEAERPGPEMIRPRSCRRARALPCRTRTAASRA